MFKGILGKRVPSSEFMMLTTPTSEESAANGKENQFAHSAGTSPIDASMPPPALPYVKPGRMPSGAWKASGKSKHPKEKSTDMAFDQLMDELQIPETVRVKMHTMEPSMKAAMLKSSQFIAQTQRDPSSPKTLRRSQSSGSLGSTSPSKDISNHASRPSVDLSSLVLTDRPTRTRKKSVVDGKAPQLFSSKDEKKGKDPKGSMRNFTPAVMVELLDESSTSLDIEIVKKLRLLLRNESANWTQQFLSTGGYSALLTRLNELLEVEWREEQHDDQMLHELLRCFKALTTSSIGCFALRSSGSTPFAQLITLIYSDKKPGEVACRYVIVEMLLALFELYPPSALPSTSSRPRREAWSENEASNLVTLPAPHKNVFSFIRQLLLTEAPAPAERIFNPVQPHEFIESLHKPRIYKTYLQELSDVCRDYFWVFCHPNNTIWALSEVDEPKVEKPRAPGGMTGGVEFEAMTYMTLHFRFVNALASAAAELAMPKEHEHSAFQFHADLFLSGFERIVLVARKASTTYYPTLHLELARYTAHAARARFELPWAVSRLIGLPPAALCLPVVRPAPVDIPLPSSPLPSPRKKRTGQQSPLEGGSFLPPTRRHEALKVD